MRTAICLTAAASFLLCVPAEGRGEEVLFQDDFKKGLSPKWEVVGRKGTDYRVKDGGLELRVQPGKMTAKTPGVRLTLPFTSDDSVSASVTLKVLDEFTQEGEFAAVFLTDEAGPEFRSSQALIGGKWVYAPGKYRFVGQPGERGDPRKYEVTYTTVTEDAGPLLILADRGSAYSRVGPSKKGDYLDFFRSAIRKDARSRGFSLIAAGAADGTAHWVRFENFRVVKH
jgi:hypothetical protein